MEPIEEGVFAVETLLKSRKQKGQLQYLVKWKGWSNKHNTWEPRENVLDDRLVEEFEQRQLQQQQQKSRKRSSTSSKKSTETPAATPTATPSPSKRRPRRLAGGDIRDESSESSDHEVEEEGPSTSRSASSRRRSAAKQAKAKKAAPVPTKQSPEVAPKSLKETAAKSSKQAAQKSLKEAAPESMEEEEEVKEIEEVEEPKAEEVAVKEVKEPEDKNDDFGNDDDTQIIEEGAKKEDVVEEQEEEEEESSTNDSEDSEDDRKIPDFGIDRMTERNGLVGYLKPLLVPPGELVEGIKIPEKAFVVCDPANKPPDAQLQEIHVREYEKHQRIEEIKREIRSETITWTTPGPGPTGSSMATTTRPTANASAVDPFTDFHHYHGNVRITEITHKGSTVQVLEL